ncbi:MAG: DUF4388 domain-containing protein [Planctomycetota bacterium]|nr:DUF4388 domain-containing protein [Planctomycetota bacterium]
MRSVSTSPHPVHMNFAGDLSNIGLSEVFEEIHLDRLTGTLSIQEHSGLSAHIHFVDGRIRLVSLGPEHPFDYPAILAEAQVVTEKALAEAARRERRRTWKSALRRSEEFDEARFDAAVAARLGEEVVDLLVWKQGTFSFSEGDPDGTRFDREQRECRILIHPKELMLEAQRRRDAWVRLRKHLATPRTEILVPAPSRQEKPPVVEDVLAYFDGTTDLSGVLSGLGEERFHVLNTIADLVEEGLLVAASVEHLHHLAADAKKNGDIHVAIRHLEAAAGRCESLDPELSQELLKLYERSGRKADASRVYMNLAADYSQRGDLDAAHDAYVRAAELVPQAAEPLRRIVEVFAARAQHKPMRKVGIRLAELFAGKRQYEDAVASYRYLLEHLNKDVELNEAIAKLYGRMHEPERAVDELMPLADFAYIAGRHDEALRLYRTVLAYDRTNERARDRMEMIESGASRLRKSTRRRRIAAVVLGIVLGLGAWQGAREWFAQEAFQVGVRAALFERTAEGDGCVPGGAAYHYALMCQDFPRTQGARKAEELLQHILLNQLARLRTLAATDRQATVDALNELDRVPWPDEVGRLWLDGRAGILTLIRTAPSAAQN